jgi:PAS domain S-box-containing protein
VELVTEMAQSAMREIALRTVAHAHHQSTQRSNATLQLILDALPSMVGFWDANLRNVYANKAYSDFFRCEPQSLRGVHVRELLGEELFEANRPFLERCLAGETVAFERDIPVPGNQVRHTLARYIPNREDGRVVGLFVLVHDITDIRVARSERDKYERALRMVSDANITLAKSETREQMMQGICRLICESCQYGLAWVGIAQNDLRKSIAPVAHSGFDMLVMEDLQFSWDPNSPLGQDVTGAALRNGRTHMNNAPEGDGQAVLPDQGVSGLKSRIAIPFQLKSGERAVLTLVATHTNPFTANEVRLLEELTNNLRFCLDAIDDRYRALIAEAKTQAKSEFLARVSHEIRNPLNSVLGTIELLALTPLQPEQQHMVQTVALSSRLLLTILDDILDISKIEAGKLHVESIPTRLTEVVDSVLQLKQSNARARSIVLTSEIDPTLPEWIQTDPLRLRQVLMNLLSNAVKFTQGTTQRPGQVRLRALACQAADGTPALRVSVTDNGIGIKPEQTARLFESFAQADSSITRQFGGTGLGLAISRQLVGLLGGQITLESIWGEGSTFTVELPLREAVGPQEPVTPLGGGTQVPVAGNATLPDAAAKGVKQRILVVDDNEINRDLLSVQVRTLGYAVDTAPDGEQALEKWRKGQVTLMLTDCRMPTMDGFELARTIRAEEAGNEHLVIIAVTGNAMEGDAQRCLDAGMDDYLSKPLGLQTLGSMLAKWIPKA